MLDILDRFGLSLLIGQAPHGPLGGVALTLLMSLAALVLAFPLAILVALARRSTCTPIRRVAAVYVYVIRGIPLLLLIFWAYFVLPLLTGFDAPASVTVVAALIVYEAAFLGEAIRGAIAALPAGQMEASRALGLGYWKTVRHVILPQALFNCLPSIVNQFIMIVKDTSLAYIVGAHEATFAATQINAQLLTQPLRVYLILAGIYFVLCYALSRLSKLLERRVTLRRNRPIAQAPLTEASA
ncbi:MULTISPECIES: amino acid ABC transporter permease [unclassified Achromobacter]|uniref:amino acid ABC transporter permease n=1 Tax=unclassified Achromobacter TaxID=2626865 RepID=UPI000B51B9E7|nr:MULTISPECIES: amino acid ABC transporter permease [unclassified Achromobacter]OWT77403.1 amino acid ABC transporter permease [Achromobacter sp. HZ28]OWT78284.1 amino acid ABC transporter permease [Achromobacter sp. HZ34]